MRKIASLTGIVLFLGSFFIASCGSSRGNLCPAYPPSPLNGEVKQKTEKTEIIYENIDLGTERI